MRYLSILILITILIITSSSTKINKDKGLNEDYCSSAFDENVKVYTLKDKNKAVGTSIWLKRNRIKAKYFAHKQYGQSVNERYDSWKPEKEIILMTGAAYVNGWRGSEIPVGITVDNGLVVNRNWERNIDGLVIVYATGGIVVSNIENGDLYLHDLGKVLDIRNTIDRAEFLSWAVKKNVSVFQTHLTIFKNELQCHYSKTARSSSRRFLVFVKNSSGELFHVIFYFKHVDYTLYHASGMILNYLKNKEMEVIAMLNLETGTYDIMFTGSGVIDCNGDYIQGRRNQFRRDIPNILTYYYE
jgi:hypothetical protein